MSFKSSRERKSHTTLTPNNKLEVIKLSEKGRLKAEISGKPGLLHQLAKEKFLKEIKSATPVNTIKHSYSSYGIEDQISHNIPLSQSLIQSEALTLLSSIKPERGEEAAEEKFEAGRSWMRFKERSYLYNIKVQGEAANVDVEAAASYPEDLAKIIDEDGQKQQIFSVDETTFYWKKVPSRTFIAREGKSICGFKSSRDRLTLLGANVAGDLKLKTMLTYHSKNSKALKNYTKSPLPVLKMEQQNLDLFTAGLTEYFKPTMITYCSEEKITFKILLLIDSTPGHLIALMKMYKKFKPANTISILQPMSQVILISKFYYLRNTFCKLIASRDSDSSDGSGKNKLKPCWKGFVILDAIKNIHDSYEEVKISTLAGVGKKLIPPLMGDFERLKTSVEGVTASVVKIVSELEFEVGPDDNDSEFLQSLCQTAMDKELLLMDEQRKWFLEMESTPGEDAENIIEMTTKYLEYYIKLTDKAAVGCERTDFNFERSSVRNHICYREIFCERKRQISLSYFKKLPQQPHPSATTTQISQQPPVLRQDPPTAKRL
uniref:DDE-1 domain-containing protein n=1 Tax=Chlorocebus sabaeus TaxID=60711 RepID=A0A0D9RKC2_CHLSB